MTKRAVTVEVEFSGDGRVVCGYGGGLTGGVVPPALDGSAAFSIHREVLDDDGLWKPVSGEGPLTGGLQINILADSDGYRELGRYFLGLAELDATVDPQFHHHLPDVETADGRTRLSVICRKSPSHAWPAHAIVRVKPNPWDDSPDS
ncbi:MAG: hypothetical protein ACRC1K_19250 [Planctomycetia bacterium]